MNRFRTDYIFVNPDGSVKATSFDDKPKEKTLADHVAAVEAAGLGEKVVYARVINELTAEKIDEFKRPRPFAIERA